MLSCFSCVRLFAAPWTVALQASPVHGILQARIPEWVAKPPPGDIPDPGIEPGPPALQEDPLPLSHWGRPPIYLGKKHPQRDNSKEI